MVIFCSTNAPISVKPQGGVGGGGLGRGQADLGEFDMEARVKHPSPSHLLNVNLG